MAAVFTQLKRCFCNKSGEEGETKKQGPNSVDLQRNFLPLRHSRSPRRSVSFRSLSFETGIEALKRICMHELITVMGWAWGGNSALGVFTKCIRVYIFLVLVCMEQEGELFGCVKGPR